MGCHSWFFKRIERTYEEAKEKWLAHTLNSIERWREIAGNPQDNTRVAYEWSQELCDYTLAVFERQYRMVSKGLCRLAVMKKQPDDDEGKHYEYVGENLYTTCDSLPHDIFRTHSYPPDRLFSMEQTARFCRERNIILSSKQLLHLNIFWEAHPDGMITFG